jgi:EmrB/QacA subfamily drug resistance transporter
VTEAARPADDRIDRGTMLALVAMALGVFVVANDFTALSVALPDIESDFDSDVSTIQWVINGYALVFGVLIVTGGRLADMFGRKRLFLLGAAIFATFSVLGGAAQSDIWLIAARALMGIGGAMMWPAVLGMTYELLPDSKAGLAGGLIIGVAGFGNAVGPLLGGALTDAASWRLILFLNLPVAAFASLVVISKVHLPTAAATDRRIDYRGVATLSIGLVALLLALDQSGDWGFGDARVIAMLVVSVLSIAAFILFERRTGPWALVPSDVMGNTDFRAACLAVLLMSATFFGAVLYLPQFMQKLLDYSPLEAGIGLLPFMAVFGIVSFGAGPLYNRLGPKPIIGVGAAGIMLGAFLLTLPDRGSGYEAIVPGMLALGIGVGLFVSSVTTAAVTALDPSRASLAGGLIYMFQVAGGSVGLGATTAVFTAASDDKLSSDISSLPVNVSERQKDAIDGILAGTDSARQTLSEFSSSVAARLTDLVGDAFAAGFDWAFRFDFVLSVGGFLVAVLFVGGPLRLGRRSRQEAPAAASANSRSA